MSKKVKKDGFASKIKPYQKTLPFDSQVLVPRFLLEP